MSFSVLLDTCVLYGTYLNDLFLRLAQAGTYRPLWSDDILDELERNLIKNGAAEPILARRRVSAMREFFKDARVIGYRELEAAMTCDPKDRHVLAAAVRANAAILLTFNLKDFPRRATDDFDIEVVHPDEFLLDQLGLYESVVIDTLKVQSAGYRHAEMTIYELLNCLEKSGVPQFSGTVRSLLGEVEEQ